MDIPGFYFCLCPDSTLAREHVDGLLKRVNAVGREREIRTFWADEGLDGRFWEALTMQGLTERPRALLVRGAQTLTAEVWKKLSAVLATPRPDILPVFFLESLWEKGQPKLPAHIAKLRCLEFADKQGWVWRSAGLDARALRKHVQQRAAALELRLTPDALDALTPADIRAVIAGNSLGEGSSRLTDIYRLVDQDTWYVAILSDGQSWNPVLDQVYYLQFEGFEDLVFSAKVTRVQKVENEVLAVFLVEDPMGPMIYQRSGRVTLSSELSGLSVLAEALDNQSGQTGVWLFDVPGGTFVPVEVLSNDGNRALIQPQAEGALQVGDRVLIK